MPDRAKYESSPIDWSRLNKYAQRVAKETRLTPAPSVVYRVETTEVVEKLEARRTFFGVRRLTTTEAKKAIYTDVEAIGPHWLLSHRRWHRDVTTQ